MTGCAPSLAQALLPYPQYCAQLQGLNENHGKSIYHSLQAKLEKRFSGGTLRSSSPTPSEAHHQRHRQHPAEAPSRGAGSSGVISPFEQDRNRALASDDVAHVLSAALVYELPLRQGQEVPRQGRRHERPPGRMAAQHGLPLLHGHPVLLPVELLQRSRPVPGRLHPGAQRRANPFAAGHGQLRPRRRVRSSTRTRSSPWTAFNFYYGTGARVSQHPRPRATATRTCPSIKNTQPGRRTQPPAAHRGLQRLELAHLQRPAGSATASRAIVPSPPIWPARTSAGGTARVTDPRNIQVAARLEF